MGSVVWLNILFMLKLRNILSGPTKVKMRRLTTRISVLCFVWTTQYILFFIVYFIIFMWNLADSPHFKCFAVIYGIFSVGYNNYLSILLSFAQFEKQYIFLCGCCDAGYNKCCGGHSNVSPQKKSRKRKNQETPTGHTTTSETDTQSTNTSIPT